MGKSSNGGAMAKKDRCIIGHDDENVAATAYPVCQVILQMAGMLSFPRDIKQQLGQQPVPASLPC